jgi:spermidine synthase
MPDNQDPAEHVKPFVYEGLSTKAMQFSLGEIQSQMQIEDPHALDLEYTRTMMGFLLFMAEPRDITMIGLGGGSLAKFCHRHLARAHIRVVEINPHVIALRDDFHIPPDGARFQVLCGDGADYVANSADPCDVLLVDGFDYDGLPSRLCSQRFYDDCLDLLQPQGVMVVNLHSDHALFEICVDRIRRSFGAAVLVVDGGDLTNTIVFACKGQTFDSHRVGVVRRPRQLDPGAADQLLASFALVTAALRDLRR